MSQQRTTPRRSKSLLPLLVLAWTAGAQADAFKCRTADGSVLISAAPCADGSTTLAIQPKEQIAPERRLQAEREVERQRKLLEEREAARDAAEKREQETRHKQAEEETAWRTRCMESAQREPDSLLRADLIAACNGAAPQRPVVVQQPVYIPVPTPRKPQHQDWGCPSGDCRPAPSPSQPPQPQPPQPQPDRSRKACRQVAGVLSCN